LANVPLPEFDYQFPGLMVIFDAGDISQLEEAPKKISKKTGEKTREKTREKIISAMKEKAEINILELAELLNLSKKGIEWQIKKLKEQGFSRRIGSDKGGNWEVIEE